jgi:protein-tyrosine kinase
MSIVEAALSKVRGQAANTPQARPRGNVKESVRRADPAAANPAATPRTFKHAAVDPQAMERNRVLPQLDDQSALRAYKVLRTRVLQRMVANNWYSLAVTGSTTGEGKTLTAINLAIALAQDVNTWVTLVDLDLQRPQVANYMGLQFDSGLGDYLVGEAALDDIFYEPAGIDRLMVIPNSRSFSNSSELLVSPRMLELRQALAAETPRRVVIFDMPPLLASDDTLAFAPHVDALLLVLAEGVSPRGGLDKAKQLIADHNLVGVVLNKSGESNDSPYY